MAKIDREGNYRGVILDSTVDTTKKSGLPRFVARLKVQEIWNPETRQWESWDYGQEIMAYLVLMTYGQNGQPEDVYHLDGVRKATGWDGRSFAELDQLQLQGRVVTFHVSEREYENKMQLQVDTIDAADAEPRQLNKLTTDELKNLDAKFQRITKPKIATPPPRPPTPQRPDPSTAATPPVTPAPVSTSAPQLTTETTEADAWDTVLQRIGTLESEEVIGQYWLMTIQGNAVDPQNLTGQEWAKVRDEVIKHFECPF